MSNLNVTPQGKQPQGAAPPPPTSQPLTPMQFIAPPPATRPPNPIMGTCEETYKGSKSYYLVFGGMPRADWSGIADLDSRSMSDLCFRSLDPVAGQKSTHFRIKPLSNKLDARDNITDFQENAYDHLLKYGLDTISYLPDPRNPTTNVLCVITKHAQFTGDMSMV